MGMLTAVVHAGDEPMALVETLAALVPAVAEGLMSHAVVTTRTPSQEIERIADAMGATYVPQVADPGARARPRPAGIGCCCSMRARRRSRAGSRRWRGI